MTLKGEKTAWLVILICALAIGILLSMRAQKNSDSDELSQSSTGEELSYETSKSRSPVGTERPNLNKAKGSVFVYSNKIVKAGIDAQTARNILALQNQAVMRRHSVIVTQEDFKNRDEILSQEPLTEPKVIADFNPINRIFIERVKAMNLRLEAQRAALSEIRSADGLPTRDEADSTAEREPASGEAIPKTLRIAVLYTSEARRYAGGTDAIYDEIKRRMSTVSRQLQSDMGYDSSTFWVARYTGDNGDSETLKKLQTVDMVLLYSGSTNRELVAITD